MIAEKNSIRIDHRNNIKVIIISELRDLIDPVNQTLQCPIGRSLARVSPRHDNNYLSGLILLVSVNNFYSWDVQT